MPRAPKVTAGGGGRSAISIDGLDDFRADLKAVGDDWPKQLAKINREVKTAAVKWSRADLKVLGGVHAKSAKGVTGWASQKAASVGVKTGGSRYPWAAVGVWGADRRTGWYGKARYYGLRGGRQHPAWVGSDWRVGVRGEGPYGINTALHDHHDEIAAMFADGLADLAARAFTDK